MPPEATNAGAGGQTTPSPQRVLEAGNGGGAPTSPRAAPGAAMSPRQEALDASTRIEASAPSSGAGILVQHGARHWAAHRRAVVVQALRALGVVEVQIP